MTESVVKGSEDYWRASKNVRRAFASLFGRRYYSLDDFRSDFDIDSMPSTVYIPRKFADTSITSGNCPESIPIFYNPREGDKVYTIAFLKPLRNFSSKH